MHDPSRVRVTGPLETFAVGFAAVLRVDGYTARGITGQLQLMAHLSRWLAQEQLGVASLTGTVVERFVAARRAAGYAQFRSRRALEPLLYHLRELGQAPPPSLPEPEGPVEELLWRYRRYLVEERGLRAASAAVYVDAVRPFLGTRLTPQGLQLADLDAGWVAGFVLAQERGSAKQMVSRLRSLLGLPAPGGHDPPAAGLCGASGRAVAIVLLAEGDLLRRGAAAAGCLRPAHGHGSSRLRDPDHVGQAGSAPCGGRELAPSRERGARAGWRFMTPWVPRRVWQVRAHASPAEPPRSP